MPARPATIICNLFGLTALAYMWALMAEAALAAKANGGGAIPSTTPSWRPADYFVERVVPDAGAHLAKIKSGAGPVMALSGRGVLMASYTATIHWRRGEDAFTDSKYSRAHTVDVRWRR